MENYFYVPKILGG